MKTEITLFEETAEITVLENSEEIILLHEAPELVIDVEVGVPGRKGTDGTNGTVTVEDPGDLRLIFENQLI